jgi:hypothetical protein
MDSAMVASKEQYYLITSEAAVKGYLNKRMERQLFGWSQCRKKLQKVDRRIFFETNST